MRSMNDVIDITEIEKVKKLNFDKAKDLVEINFGNDLKILSKRPILVMALDKESRDTIFDISPKDRLLTLYKNGFEERINKFKGVYESHMGIKTLRVEADYS